MIDLPPRAQLAFNRYLHAATQWATGTVAAVFLLGDRPDSAAVQQQLFIDMRCAQAVLEWELTATPALAAVAYYDDQTMAELLGAIQS